MQIDGKWLHLSEDFIHKHPGGAVITQYRNSDATHVFHAFHEGSEKAYKQMEGLRKNAWDPSEDLEKALLHRHDQTDVNVSAYDISLEEEKRIVAGFERLRQTMHDRGLMKENPGFYYSKTFETLSLMVIAFLLQYTGWYFTSAVFLGVCWQQLGWLTHEFCHHEPFKNRHLNDSMSLLLGNVAQGFSRDWWKDKVRCVCEETSLQHNTHHAVTNIVDQDGDIDLAPLFSFVPDDFKKYKQPIEKFILKFIPHQHLYFTCFLPFLRVSWCGQSVIWAFKEPSSEFRVYRKNAISEQVSLSLHPLMLQLGIILHWSWVVFQLYLLPSWTIRVMYFLVSQLLGGLLVAVVVTYSHNSVDKYPTNSRILNNFACSSLFTTRNLHPGPVTDWFWGGLNYQIEHHMFPTMPRPNLNAASKLVKEFAAEFGLPYYVDDYLTGYKLNLQQLENIARIAPR